MIMPVVIILVVWIISLLNIANITHSMDPINSLLLAVAVTIFSIRYSIRHRNNGNKKKPLSF